MLSVWIICVLKKKREVFSQGSTRGFSGYLCLVVLFKVRFCPQGQTLTVGANFVSQRKLCPRWWTLPLGANFASRNEFWTQGRTLRPGVNITPGADFAKVEFCFQRQNLPTGANFAPGCKLQTVLPGVAFLTRGEVGSQSLIRSRTLLTCAFSRFFFGVK